MKSSLVILYHRQPYDEVINEHGMVQFREKKSPNGIVPTLKSFFASVDRGTWIAWKEVTQEQKSGFEERVVVEPDANYSVRRLPLTAEQVKHFYHITSKEAFWPILHSFPYHFTSESSDWENFKIINFLFASAACEEAADDAVIWVHDYNLWLAPLFIRQQKPDARIAFFHHTPFPAPDIFNILPWRESIIDSLLCCDICGFHIPRYAENFVATARSLREIEILKREPVPAYMSKRGMALSEPEVTLQIKHQDQVVNVDSVPVGTNPQQIFTRLQQQEAQEQIERIKQDYDGQKLIISAGRIDYVKGNRELLECYERLLDRRPDLHSKVSLILICASPAQGMQIYKTAQEQIEQLVGKINGRFNQLDWSPIKLFTKPVPFAELVCLFKVADICWTTPLRDGLNLVCKEYVVAHEGQDGVLILSEFVGAAVELPDALLTNTYSTDNMDQTLEIALSMPVAEQQARMTKMYDTVTKYDVKHWADHLFDMFKQIMPEIQACSLPGSGSGHDEKEAILS
ncbi:glucosyl-glycerol phosphate synthase [Thalassoporum mexicanum PCC 7367]|uniref:glucosylglycerol-phosphate synthase n=1 Tax=Thalassoporum mexicanum TaxID=3457544 RepID=UPI00029FE89D|nr:glucosylglycerol-phosphate synthase [Pseudanabaena sp. PCC 7367]AFY69137.1 glucosyl-glycerol phosphate synthase [Pseudanabaena sp. PCC 7367]